MEVGVFARFVHLVVVGAFVCQALWIDAELFGKLFEGVCFLGRLEHGVLVDPSLVDDAEVSSFRLLPRSDAEIGKLRVQLVVKTSALFVHDDASCGAYENGDHHAIAHLRTAGVHDQVVFVHAFKSGAYLLPHDDAVSGSRIDLGV